MLEILKNHVPEAAATYCETLHSRYPFELKLPADRKSKSGDYRYLPETKSHRISVNSGLNPYSFLITYVHEVAHLVAFETHGKKISPHGKEWKEAFRNLMLPLLNPSVFPDGILKTLAKHLKNPKASSYSDQNLVRQLRAYDPKQDAKVSLESLENGSHFQLNGKRFEKLETRRTRAICKLLPTNKKYLVSKVTLVEPEI